MGGGFFTSQTVKMDRIDTEYLEYFSKYFHVTYIAFLVALYRTLFNWSIENLSEIRLLRTNQLQKYVKMVDVRSTSDNIRLRKFYVVPSELTLDNLMHKPWKNVRSLFLQHRLDAELNQLLILNAKC